MGGKEKIFLYRAGGGWGLMSTHRFRVLPGQWVCGRYEYVSTWEDARGLCSLPASRCPLNPRISLDARRINTGETIPGFHSRVWVNQRLAFLVDLRASVSHGTPGACEGHALVVNHKPTGLVGFGFTPWPWPEAPGSWGGSRPAVPGHHARSRVCVCCCMYGIYKDAGQIYMYAPS